MQQVVRATIRSKRLPAGDAGTSDIIGHRGPQQAMDCAACPQGLAGRTGAMAMIAMTRLATALAIHFMLTRDTLRAPHPWSVTQITRRSTHYMGIVRGSLIRSPAQLLPSPCQIQRPVVIIISGVLKRWWSAREVFYDLESDP